MNKLSWLKKIALLIFAILLLSSPSFCNLAREEAKAYRNKGYEAQKIGDYDAARMFYEKSIAIDPSYSVVYNDLGVLYEQMGNSLKAEFMYQRAAQIEPDSPEAYYNLASLYETKGDFLKAAFYWERRLQLGQADDPGTLKAIEHLRQIGRIYPEVLDRLKKQEAERLLDSLLKDDFQKSKQRLIGSYLEKGKREYKLGNYPLAIKTFLDALYLDPRNKEAQSLLEESQKRMLLK